MPGRRQQTVGMAADLAFPRPILLAAGGIRGTWRYRSKKTPSGWRLRWACFCSRRVRRALYLTTSWRTSSLLTLYRTFRVIVVAEDNEVVPGCLLHDRFANCFCVKQRKTRYLAHRDLLLEMFCVIDPYVNGSAKRVKAKAGPSAPACEACGMARQSQRTPISRWRCLSWLISATLGR
jgi:hypothetical protein